jgi:hypothetical protein
LNLPKRIDDGGYPTTSSHLTVASLPQATKSGLIDRHGDIHGEEVQIPLPIIRMKILAT